MKLEDLRAKIGLMSDEDLQKRVIEIRRNRLNFIAEKNKAEKKKVASKGVESLSKEDLLSLMNLLEET